MSENKNEQVGEILETSLENETTVGGEAESATGVITEEQKRDVMIGWGLFAIGMFTGIFYIAAFVWALLKKDPQNSEFERTHYKGMTSLFIWSVILGIIGSVLSVVFIGFFVLIGVGIWNVYRIILGLIKSSEKKPMPIKK